MPIDQAIVRVAIALPPATERPKDAKLEVRLEDVTRADAPARIVDLRIQPLPLDAGMEVHVVLSAAVIDQRARYIVRARLGICVEQDELKPGDYATAESYPVLTFGRGDSVVITLRKVIGGP